MSLLRREAKDIWNPWQELRSMSERIDRLMGTGFPLSETEQSLRMLDWSPASNVSETERAYLVKVDLPEVKKDDVKVTQANGVLTIEGERKQEKREASEKFHRIESSYGRFMRSFTLPQDADEEHIEATFKDGALTVQVPKSTAKQQAKSRQIKVS